jgi:hypothetical protein
VRHRRVAGGSGEVGGGRWWAWGGVVEGRGGDIISLLRKRSGRVGHSHKGHTRHTDTTAHATTEIKEKESVRRRRRSLRQGLRGTGREEKDDILIYNHVL